MGREALNSIKLERKALINTVLSMHSIAELYEQSKRYICLTALKVLSNIKQPRWFGTLRKAPHVAGTCGKANY